MMSSKPVLILLVALLLISTGFASGVGGTITTIMDGGVNYTIHTFTSNSTFNWTGTGQNITVLVVAGGGSAGTSNGGGGGAGGVLYNTTYTISSGSTTVIIGEGGTGQDRGIPGNGQNSTFGSLIAIGGGGGGGINYANGYVGGSGGGGGTGGTGAAGTAGQGNAGGNGGGADKYPGGGGGGCNQTGANYSGDNAGNGGDGCAYDINGSTVYYGGGGGGGSYATGGTGGDGGGGAGCDSGSGVSGYGDNGTANTGGGAGGSCNNADFPYAHGGSGIVIVRYETFPFINYTYSRPCYINTTVSSSLTNFPAYCILDTQTLISAGKMNTSCQDLRVSNNLNDTALSFEIENNTCNTTSTVIWLRLPTTTAGGNDTVFLHYGNPSASDGQNKTDVWLNYVDVWHFGNDYLSSTRLNNFTSSTCSFVGNAYGRGGGLHCIGTNDGADQVASVTTTPSYGGFTNTSLSGWFNVSSNANGVSYMQLRESAGWGHRQIAYRTTGGFGVWAATGAGNTELYTNADPAGNGLYYFMGYFDKTNNNLSVRLNSTTNSTTMVSWGDAGNEFYLGAGYNGYGADAFYYELRVMNTSIVGGATSDYIKAEYAQTYLLGDESLLYADWTYNRSCSINTTVATSLTNFPAYCILDTQTLISAGKMNTSCQDLRVSQNNSARSFEIENNTCNTTSTVVWLRLPTTTAGGNDTVFLHYGNPSASDGQNVLDVWRPANYVGVWHCGNTTNDSSGNDNGLTPSNIAEAYTVSTNSKYGHVCFASGDSYWSKSNPTGLPAADTAETMSLWVSNNTVEHYAGEGTLIAHGKAAGGTKTTRSLYDASGNVSIGAYDYTLYSDRPLAHLTTWQYFSWSYNTSHFLFDVNGTNSTPVASDDLATDNDIIVVNGISWLASYGYQNVYFDEMRISNDSKSSDWLKAEYGQTYSLGNESGGGGITPVLNFVSPTPPNGVNNFTYGIALNFTSDIAMTGDGYIEIDGINNTCSRGADNLSCNYTLTIAQHIFNNSYDIKPWANISGVYYTNTTLYNFSYYGCGMLISNGTLISNITHHNLPPSSSGSCININTSGVIFDGAGYSISHTGIGNGYDIFTTSANDVIIKNAILTDATMSGVATQFSNNITIINNTISDIVGGIGINLFSSDYINVSNNTITGNLDMAIALAGADHSYIYDNRIQLDVGSTYELDILGSTNDTIYNNIFNTTKPAHIYGGSSNIYLNTTKTLATNIIGGANIGGNFWSNYTGIDFNGDGIGDTTYTTGGVTDYLPLANTTGSIYWVPSTPANASTSTTYSQVLNFTSTVNMTDCIIQFNGINHTGTVSADNKSCEYAMRDDDYIFNNTYQLVGYANISGTMQETNETRVYSYFGCGYFNADSWLTADILNDDANYPTCIFLNASDITVDCLGYKANSTFGHSFGFHGNQYNDTLTNCSFDDGISYLDPTDAILINDSYINLTNNTFLSNTRLRFFSDCFSVSGNLVDNLLCENADGCTINIDGDESMDLNLVNHGYVHINASTGCSPANIDINNSLLDRGGVFVEQVGAVNLNITNTTMEWFDYAAYEDRTNTTLNMVNSTISNSGYGIFTAVESGAAKYFDRIHFYNITGYRLVQANASVGATATINLDELIIDTVDGNLTNYTNISQTIYIADMMTNGRYFLNMSSNQSVPASYRLFGQILTMTTSGYGSGETNWTWLDTQLGTINESKLVLATRVSGTWSVINATPDTINNQLYMGFADPWSGGDYALLEDLNNISANIYSPVNTTYYSNNVTVNVSCNGSYLSYLMNITLNGSAFMSNYPIANATTQVNYTIMPNGFHNISLTCWNGTMSATTAYNFTIADLAPNLTIVSPINATYNGPVLVNISAADPDLDTVWFFNGTANVTYTVPVTLAFPDGAYTLTAWANDSFGNTNTTNVNFTVDTVAPNITIQSPANISYTTTTIDLNFTANDSLGISDCWFSINATANQSLPGCANTTIANFAQGANNLTVYVNDTANNVNSAIVYFFVDSLSPTIAIISPFNTTYNTSVLVNISANDTNLDKVWFFNGTANVTYTVPVTLAFPDGYYTLTAWANDTVGNINTTNVNFTVDKTAPIIYLTLPAAGASAESDTWLFRFNVSDMMPTTSCAILLNGSIIHTNAAVANATPESHTETGVTWGYHSWYVTCNDTNNTATSSTRYFNATDATAPNISYVTYTDTHGTTKYTTTTSWIADNITANDSFSGLKSIQTSLYKGGVLLSVQTSATSPLTVNWSGLAAGTYTFNSSATDNAGNQANLSSRTVTIVVVTVPHVSILTPVGSSSDYSVTATCGGAFATYNCNLFIDGALEDTQVCADSVVCTFNYASPHDCNTTTAIVSCTDAIFQQGNDTRVFIQEPSYSNVAPANGLTITNTTSMNFTMNWSCTPNNVSLMLTNPNSANAMNCSANWNCSFIDNNWTNGLHMWSFRTGLTSGGYVNSPTYNFMVPAPAWNITTNISFAHNYTFTEFTTYVDEFYTDYAIYFLGILAYALSWLVTQRYPQTMIGGGIGMLVIYFLTGNATALVMSIVSVVVGMALKYAVG